MTWTSSTFLLLPTELIRAIFQHLNTDSDVTSPDFCNVLSLSKALYPLVLLVLYTDVAFHAEHTLGFISALQQNVQAARALRHLTILPFTERFLTRDSTHSRSSNSRKDALHRLSDLPKEARMRLLSLTIHHLDYVPTKIPLLPNLRELKVHGYYVDLSIIMPHLYGGFSKLEIMELTNFPIPPWTFMNGSFEAPALKSLQFGTHRPQKNSIMMQQLNNLNKRHFQPSESLRISLRQLSLNLQLLVNDDSLPGILLSFINLTELSLIEVENTVLPVLSNLRYLWIQQRLLQPHVHQHELTLVIPELDKFNSLQSLHIENYAINRPHKDPYKFSLSMLHITGCELSDSLAVDMLLRTTIQLRVERCSIDGTVPLLPLPNLKILEYSGKIPDFNAFKGVATNLRAVELSASDKSQVDPDIDFDLSMATLQVLKIRHSSGSPRRMQTLMKCIMDGNLGSLEHVIFQAPPKNADPINEILKDSGVKVNERTWEVAKSILLSEASPAA
ncbi:hypothetical protein BT69DRAFT_1349044 [Atractiella rhizophila]|nr:hypothetical protein BT69DRAFT_1349044 [Atractiella rhizophila]